MWLYNSRNGPGRRNARADDSRGLVTPWENPAIGLGEAQKHVAYNMQNLEDALSTVHMAPLQTYDFWLEETSRIRRFAGHYVRALDSWLIEWAKKNNKKELLRKDNFWPERHCALS